MIEGATVLRPPLSVCSSDFDPTHRGRHRSCGHGTRVCLCVCVRRCPLMAQVACRCFLVVAMARTQTTFLLLLLVSSGLLVSCSCPDSCTCRDPYLLNCSSAGLTSPPRPMRASVAQLDLSHNLLRAVALDGRRPNLRDVWLGDNLIRHMSLCVGGDTSRTRRGQACESWAPALRRLSVERNRLQRLPQGLESSRSLQVLQLSFNRISALRPADLRHLRQLEELHLDHNLIWSLHPQTFQGLTHLRVLDLSFNMLTSLHPSTYFSLRNMAADVALAGNRWRCDCKARGLRRRMAYDGSRGLRAWSLVCASPSVLSGRDLLQLEDDHLDCSGADGGTELHRDVTICLGGRQAATLLRVNLRAVCSLATSRKPTQDCMCVCLKN
ncbi:uncharacterized protein lrrc66 isoform 2-T2 [Spinachia spinachia]